MGLAWDGDADRLGVVAADGTIIWADRLMLLFARSVLKERPGSEILFDVKCSRVLPEGIVALGGRPSMCPTGHSLIRSRLRKTGAALAGELSGHIFFNDRWGGFDDGLYAGARLCEIVAADPRSALCVFSELPNTIHTPELRLEMGRGRARSTDAGPVGQRLVSRGRDLPDRWNQSGFCGRLWSGAAFQYHTDPDFSLRGHQPIGAGAHPATVSATAAPDETGPGVAILKSSPPHPLKVNGLVAMPGPGPKSPTDQVGKAFLVWMPAFSSSPGLGFFRSATCGRVHVPTATVTEMTS